MKRRLREDIKMQILKAVMLLLIFVVLSSSYSLFTSLGVEIRVDKGYVLERANIIFDKNPPPNSDFAEAFRIRLLSKNYEGDLTIKLDYEGNDYRILSDKGIEYSSKEGKLYIYVNVGKEEVVDIYLIGFSSIGIPSVSKGKVILDSDTKEETPPPSPQKEQREDKEVSAEIVEIREDRGIVLDEFSIIILVLSVIFLVASSLVIASLTPKPKRKKPITPGEIIFKEEF